MKTETSEGGMSSLSCTTKDSRGYFGLRVRLPQDAFSEEGS